MDIVRMEDWGLGLDASKPIVISGPCSAESEEQVLETCREIVKNAPGQVHILRAGIWKPRTKPRTFEGIGSVGLDWLKKAGEENNLPVCVEVANAKHVFEALRKRVDILWLGARTTVNPFAVQEIADALEGVDIPVVIKNPINPDLGLWVGAFQRFYAKGIKKLAAVHRGFNVPNSAPYRNRPMWSLALDLKKEIPGMQIINDPSHICGTRDLIAKVSQKALDLGLDGLMIESHINPSVALSDAKQQVKPEGLASILNNLVVRAETSSDPVFNSKLASLREDIDNLDKDIVALLGKRMSVAREIGQYKKENDIQILQAGRWEELTSARKQEGDALALSADFMETLLQAIHKESIDQQTEVMNNGVEA